LDRRKVFVGGLFFSFFLGAVRCIVELGVGGRGVAPVLVFHERTGWPPKPWTRMMLDLGQRQAALGIDSGRAHSTVGSLGSSEADRPDRVLTRLHLVGVSAPWSSAMVAVAWSGTGSGLGFRRSGVDIGGKMVCSLDGHVMRRREQGARRRRRCVASRRAIRSLSDGD
jgi:hypothetical protein